MKPTLPDDREIEETGAEVSERYRATAQDEPPVHLDAQIRDAARSEIRPARRERDWQIPVSIAAVLVLAVSLGLVVRDHEPPLSSKVGMAGDHPSAEEAKLAKATPPPLEMRSQPKQKVEIYREARPSRERVERPDRQLLAARDEPAKPKPEVLSSAPAADAMAPATVVPVPPSAPATLAQQRSAPSLGVSGFSSESEKEQANVGQSVAEDAPAQKAETAGTLEKHSTAVLAFRKQDEAPPPQEWIRKIEDLLKSGKRADARDQLLAMRRQYPAYPLTEQLQALLGEPR
jgi:hypothetical protein